MSRKRAKDDPIDYLVMLLSTDWFYSFWPTLGVQVHEKKKKEVQKHCRELVNSFAASGDYFMSDLSDTRKLATRAEFSKRLDSSQLDIFGIASVLHALDRKSYSQERLLLAEDLTALMAENYFDSDLQLEPDLKSKLLASWLRRKELYDEWGILDVWFKDYNLASDSTWDLFVRQLTPGIPTVLSDLLSESIFVPEIEYVWCATSEQLTDRERLLLLEWYRRTSKSLSNQVLTLKTFSLSTRLNSIQNSQTDFGIDQDSMHGIENS